VLSKEDEFLGLPEAAIEVCIVKKRDINTCLGPHLVENKESCHGKRL
jgi:hypothetical protein